MEKKLYTLNIISKSLINEKDELRKKLLEKIIYCNCYEKLNYYEETLIEKASILFKDEEYEKLRINYLKLNRLTNSINNFLEEF